jgi:hypothetical protein
MAVAKYENNTSLGVNRPNFVADGVYNYKVANPDNKWKRLIDSVKNKFENDVPIDGEQIDKVVSQFVAKLLEDNEKLINGEDVSECAFYAPRHKSIFSKKTGIGGKVVDNIFPFDTQELAKDGSVKPVKVRRVYSYMRYQRMVTALARKWKKQLAEVEIDKWDKRQSWKTGMRKDFCSMKTKAPTDFITTPIAMPVDVAPHNELVPFFELMLSNSQVLDTTSLVRGTFFPDGRLDMCKQVVGPPWIAELMASIRNNPYVEHFLLGNNIVGLPGATAIADFISKPHAGKVKTWYLAGNDITGDGMKLVATALAVDVDATALWLKRNPIGPDGAYWVGKMLEVNNKLKTIDLHNTGIMDKGCEVLFEGLAQNRTLKYLYLDANGLTPTSAVYIATYFNNLVAKNEVGITSITFNMNRLDDEGVMMIVDSLEHYHALERVDFGSNRIGANTAKYVLDKLMNHPNLIFIGLGCYKSTGDLGELPNNLLDEGAAHVAEFIRNNKTVKVLEVDENGFTNTGIDLLNDAIKENDTLLQLRFAQFKLRIPIEVRNEVTAKLDENCMNYMGITNAVFIKDMHCRFLKHTPDVVNIDSIYRNKM